MMTFVWVRLEKSLNRVSEIIATLGDYSNIYSSHLFIVLYKFYVAL